MKVRTTTTRNQIDLAVTLKPVQVKLDLICPHCCEVKDEAMMHSCGECINCCACLLCKKCNNPLILDGCSACGFCRDCCKCYVCRDCQRAHVQRSFLCDICGKGIRSAGGCGCCMHGSTTDVIHKRRDANLSLYTATPETLQYNKSPRLLSAEIEICGMKKDTSHLNNALAAWNASVVSDGSLPGTGFEINTHPAAGDYWNAQVNDICAGLRTGGGWVNERAGCHTHVDARDFGYLSLGKLLFLVGCTEAGLFQMLPKERRHSHFCAYWAPNYLPGLIAAYNPQNMGNERRLMVHYRRTILKSLYRDFSRNTVIKVRQSKGNDTRYRGTNLHSWFYRGTIEFRMPPGTISPQNIINWGLLLGNILDIALYRSHEEIMSMVDEMLKLMKQEELFHKPLADLEKCHIGPSVELLKNLSPTTEVRDWIIERIKAANKITGPSWTEAY